MSDVKYLFRYLFSAGFSLAATLGLLLPSGALLLPAGADEPRESRAEGPIGRYWIGITLEPIPDKEQSKGPGAEARIKVESVFAGSPAAKADIHPNDLILGFGDKPIGEYPAFVKAIEESDGKTLKLHLVRDGKKRVVEIKPERRQEREVIKEVEERREAEESRRQQDRAQAQLQEARHRLDQLIQQKLVEKQVEEGRGQQERAEGQLREARKHLDELIQQKLKDELSGPRTKEAPAARIVLDGLRLFTAPVPPPIASPAVAAGLPENMEVTIQKQGKSPARIVVKQGHREWRTIEGDLEMLPPEARAYIQRALGQGVPQIKMPFRFNISPGDDPKKGASGELKPEAIELELKLGPGGVVESAETRNPKGIQVQPGLGAGFRIELQEGGVRDGAKLFWRELHQVEPAGKEEKAKEDEVRRLRDQILKLHGELQESRKAWDEKLKEFSPKREKP